MRHYETTFVMRPNLGEEQFTEIIERTAAIITDHGGTIITIDRWGLRRLAYEIKKETQGYYVYMRYATQGDAIQEMERVFRLDERLLRYLSIKLADNIDEATLEQEKARVAAAQEEEAASSADNEDDAATVAPSGATTTEEETVSPSPQEPVDD